MLTEERSDDIVNELDRLISSAYEAKEAFLNKRYEDAAGELDDAARANKKAKSLINELWE